MEHMNNNNIVDEVNDENVLFGTMERVDGSGGDGGNDGGEVNLKKGPWTTAEDVILLDYVTKHGEGNWNVVRRNTCLNRCGKSCRLRWANHLRPNLKKGSFSHQEEKLIVESHAQFGNKWARMAALLPGRTDNEIKNYWNTRIKRRQRQRLSLYSNEQDRHNTPTTPTTPSPSHCITPRGSNPNNNTTKFEFFHQNHPQYHQQNHQLHPLSPTQTHHKQHEHSYSPHTFLDISQTPTLSSSSPSQLSFPYQRPALLLSSPFRFKRYRSSPNLNLTPPNAQNCSSTLHDPSLTSHNDGFRFPSHHNSSFSQYFNTPFVESDGLVSSSNLSFPFSTKLELPTNSYSRLNLEQDVNKANNNFYFNNDHNYDTKKRSYLSLNEGNYLLNGYCQSLDDFPLSSIYWSSNSEQKVKKESPDLSKFTNDDMSTMLSVMPSSTIQNQDWNNNQSEVSNIQSSSGMMENENFKLDVKPIASLFSLTNTITNHDNENNGCYTWENLSELC